VDLSGLLAAPELEEGRPRRRIEGPPPVLGDNLDWQLVERARPALAAGEPVRIDLPIRNVDRCVGGILSSHVARRYGLAGLPPDTIQVAFRGSAGQSFAGWLANGVTFTLHGDANDYAGKGLSGGTFAVLPQEGATFRAEDNVVVGNTVLYGATSGKAFFRGLAGERFAVRNSGADAVVEGVGDHGCEYMTGGRVVVLGPTGRNFAAGMSGGLAFVLDEDGTLRRRVNTAVLDQLEGLDEADAIELRALVEEHRDRTGSPVAQRVLDGWEELRERFVKVFPTDYKRVLRERAEAERAAQPPRADEFADGRSTDVVGEPSVRTGEGE
jgi:glutamate synthase (NADPH/NADH) large chain/glutamate synthase (ferredoxin)